MYEQIAFSDSEGKTVKGVVTKSEAALVVFTDLTFAVIEAEGGYDDDASLDCDNDSGFNYRHWESSSAKQLFELEQIAVWEAEIEAVKAADAKRHLEYKRREYERLKAEFGSA